jgi:MFS family permease
MPADAQPGPDPTPDSQRHPDLEDEILAEEVAGGLTTPMAPIESDSPDTPAARGLRHAFRALRYRDFALFWSGALISNTGSWMQNVTVPYVMTRLASPVWVGLATFAQFVPALLTAPRGGITADRVSRKKILLVTQSIAALVALALWALWSSGHASPGRIVALLIVLGVTSGFAMPAWQSFLPQLVPRDEMMNAVTLNSAQFNASRAIGPMVGGAVLRFAGPGGAFFANAVSFLFVISALLLVRVRYAATPRPSREAGAFHAAIVYTRRHTGIVVALTAVAVVTFLGSPVVVFLAVFVKDVYHRGVGGYAVLYAFFGVGAVVGAVLLGAFADGVRRSRLALGAVSLFAAAVLLLGATKNFAVAFVAIFTMGLAYIGLVSALQTAIHLLVADEYRGRVMALYGMAFTLGFPLGALVQGGLTSAFGPRTDALVAGALLALFAVVLRARRDVLRSIDEHVHREIPLAPGR